MNIITSIERVIKWMSRSLLKYLLFGSAISLILRQRVSMAVSLAVAGLIAVVLTVSKDGKMSINNLIDSLMTTNMKISDKPMHDLMLTDEMKNGNNSNYLVDVGTRDENEGLLFSSDDIAVETVGDSLSHESLADVKKYASEVNIPTTDNPFVSPDTFIEPAYIQLSYTADIGDSRVLVHQDLFKTLDAAYESNMLRRIHSVPGIYDPVKFRAGWDIGNYKLPQTCKTDTTACYIPANQRLMRERLY